MYQVNDNHSDRKYLKEKKENYPQTILSNSIIGGNIYNSKTSYTVILSFTFLIVASNATSTGFGFTIVDRGSISDIISISKTHLGKRKQPLYKKPV
jgi:hypothetical protein